MGAQSEHVNRKVKNLDTVITKINSRYRDAQDGVVRLKHELERKDKTLAFAILERDKLKGKIDSNTVKSMALREQLRKVQGDFDAMVSNIRTTSLKTLNG